jgi:alginate O-acetyltransferase complex protein AlgJ
MTASKHTLLCASVLCATMIFGAYQILAAALNPDGLVFPRGSNDFREGRSTQTIEKQLDLKLPVREFFIAIANTTRYQLFSGAADQVRTGKGGWLFLTEEIKHSAPSSAFNTRIELMADISKKLQAQGVKLIVALVPDKARVYSNQLQGGEYPIYNQTRYSDAFNALQKAKVSVVDLYTPFARSINPEIYYRTDTHWNQLGAKLAATEISKAIENLKIELERTRFVSMPTAGLQNRSGDLIRLMGLEHVPSALRPPLDQEAPEQTVEKNESLKNVSQGLFGDSVVPVVLTGTSYSLRGNFHGYLQESLSSKVLNTAKDGGGFLQGLTAYLADEAFKVSKPKVLIWEVPERMLNLALETEINWTNKSGL